MRQVTKVAAIFAAIAAVFGVSAMATPAHAQIDTGYGTLSPSVAFTTNYIFRGLSQTRKDPAVQGAVEYTKEFGDFTPYLGTFISNVKFPSNNTPAGTTDIRQTREVDFFGGLRIKTPLDGLSVDLGVIKYWYPSNTADDDGGRGANTYGDPQWTEAYGKAAFDAGFATLVVSAFYAKDFSYGAGKGVYLEGGFDVPVLGFLVSGRVGRQTIERNFQFGVPDYTTWNVGVARDMEWPFTYTASLVYSDTNIKRGKSLGTDTVAVPAAGAVVQPDTYETAKPQVSLTLTKKF